MGGNVLRNAENLRIPVTRRPLAGGPFDWLLDTKSIGADLLDEAERVREPARPTLIVLDAPDRAGRLVGLRFPTLHPAGPMAGNRRRSLHRTIFYPAAENFTLPVRPCTTRHPPRKAARYVVVRREGRAVQESRRRAVRKGARYRNLEGARLVVSAIRGSQYSSSYIMSFGDNMANTSTLASDNVDEDEQDHIFHLLIHGDCPRT